MRLNASVRDRKISGWKVEGLEERPSVHSSAGDDSAKVALFRNFEFRLPLRWLLATPGSEVESVGQVKLPVAAAIPATSELKLRFSLWQNRLPVDALPVEGWIELQLVSEWELGAGM